jgi:hypothetical protein
VKQKLLYDKDLLQIWGFFLDHLGADPDFMALGEPASHQFLEAVISQVSLQMFPQDGMVIMARLVRLANQQFIHGGVNVAGRVGGVFYFEEIQVGLLAVSDHFPSDETKVARFSGQTVRRKGPPSKN